MRAYPHRRPRSRRAMTLVEIMVVIAIVAVIVGIAVPSLSAAFDLQVREAASTLGRNYTSLLEEAAMRNVSFRVAYNLDRNTWMVEVGDPDALVFDSPEKRAAWEQELKDEMKRYTQRELEEGKLAEIEEKAGRFQGLDDEIFTTAQELPRGSRFDFVYTPQYGPEGLRASDEPPEEPEDEAIAYTYIFPSGTAEHTVVRIVDEDDPEDGYTIEVEPISGRVSVTTELVDPTQSMAWLPEEGPELQ